MTNLGRLTTGEIAAVRRAVSYLLEIDKKHEILPRETWGKIDTFGADVEAEIEERRNGDRRARVAETARLANRIPD